MVTRLVTVMECVCDKCEHVWIPRPHTTTELPRLCPRCRSVFWNHDDSAES